MDESTITPALDELRGLVRADGGDMTVDGVDGTTIRSCGWSSRARAAWSA